MLDLKRFHEMLDLLGCDEPLGISYVDEAPENSTTPSPGRACIISYMRIARLKRQCVHFTADVKGCPGGWSYLGYTVPAPPFINHFVTTGLPDREGEHYLPSPASMERFFADCPIPPAPAPFCMAQPLSMYGEAGAQLVAFHCRAEELTGLHMLTGFALDDHNACVFPFGAGCSNLFSWPLHYQRTGQRKAVIGGADPSCRPFMKHDELTFTVTADILNAMIDAVPASFLTGKTWAAVRQKIDKSRETWGD
ncbi:MAG: DUF169 domain-containing protein [Mailhella sp.]|nr:DUF169 domain-containing protein [Mailhella sp.]